MLKKIYLLATVFVLFFLMNEIYAQKSIDYDYRLGKINIFKVSPALSKTNFKGGILMYETGSGLEQVSLQLTVKYFSGVDEDSIKADIPRHWRFEIQPKFYGIRYMSGVYFGPFFVTYNDGTPSLGAAAGVQWIIKRLVAIDANLRMQLSNDIENRDNPSPVFIRPVLTVGILFEKTKK